MSNQQRTNVKSLLALTYRSKGLSIEEADAMAESKLDEAMALPAVKGASAKSMQSWYGAVRAITALTD